MKNENSISICLDNFPACEECEDTVQRMSRLLVGNTYVLELDQISPEYENILIKFKDERVCKEVIIKNPYNGLCGVGLTGNTKTVDSNGKIKKSYNVWKGMIYRCYGQKEAEKLPTYRDCIVCDEWLCYANFEHWWDDNYYEVSDQEMNLDKDILFKGNKVYSPQTCVITPKNINLLFVKRDAKRGDLPVGVSYYKRDKKYTATLREFGKPHFLGLYDTPIEAFNAYKQAKERFIKAMADEYQDKIPQKLYDAMHKWEVEISD